MIVIIDKILRLIVIIDKILRLIVKLNLMKNTKTIILACFILSIFHLSAQNNSIRLYSNFNRIAYFGGQSMFKQFSFGYFSPSISFNKDNGNFHEVELTTFGFGQNENSQSIIDINGNSQLISGEIVKRFNFGAKYEFSYKIFKQSNSRLSYYIGSSYSLGYSWNSRTPKLSSQYKTSSIQVSNIISLVPRLNFNLSDKWFIDFNIPINLIDFLIVRSKYMDPVLPINQQTGSYSDVNFLPNTINFKLGIGFKL